MIFVRIDIVVLGLGVVVSGLFRASSYIVYITENGLETSIISKCSGCTNAYKGNYYV
jgi:hypothetical protein